MALDAVKNFTSLPSPGSVDPSVLLLKRSSRLKHFFTTKSMTSPCVACDTDPNFWKCVDNNNRSTERRIEQLRNVQDGRVNSSDTSLHRTDIKLHAYLNNLK